MHTNIVVVISTIVVLASSRSAHHHRNHTHAKINHENQKQNATEIHIINEYQTRCLFLLDALLNATLAALNERINFTSSFNLPLNNFTQQAGLVARAGEFGRPVFELLFQQVPQTIGNAANVLGNVAMPLTTALGGIFAGLGGALAGLSTGLTQIVSGVGSAANNLATGTAAVAGQLANQTTNALGLVTGTLGNVGTNLGLIFG